MQENNSAPLEAEPDKEAKTGRQLFHFTVIVFLLAAVVWSVSSGAGALFISGLGGLVFLELLMLLDSVGKKSLRRPIEYVEGVWLLSIGGVYTLFIGLETRRDQPAASEWIPQIAIAIIMLTVGVVRIAWTLRAARESRKSDAAA